MEEDRTERAIQRIEAALARIAEAADTLPLASAQAAQPGAAPQANATPAEDAPSQGAAPGQMPASVSQLVVRHEALREEVSNQIRRIDEIVGKLEQ